MVGAKVSQPVALILAAGSGTRFTESGGRGLKQLALWEGEPVINRLVRQVRESGAFSKTVVVLGSDNRHQEAIKASLQFESVDYVVNPRSSDDNNLLSFMKGVVAVEAPVLVVESDVVVGVSDITSMVAGIGLDEVRWGELGDLGPYTHGGLIELDPATGRGISVSVLSRNDFEVFKMSSRRGVKMFGLTAFGANALSNYKSRFDLMPDVSQRYFHQVIINWPNLFELTTFRVDPKCFSFNTISELSD